MRLKAASKPPIIVVIFAAIRIALFFPLFFSSFAARRIRCGSGGAAAAGRALKNENEVTAYVRAHAHCTRGTR